MGDPARRFDATAFFATEGIWPLCVEAQGDGVPCPDPRRRCDRCDRPARWSYDELQPDPFDGPLPVSGA